MKNIKNIYKIALFLILTLVLGSCEKILDQQPYSQLSEEQFWNNNTDAASGTVAIYDAMQKTYSSKYYRWGEFRADSYVRNQTAANAESLELLNNAITASNEATLRWNSFYLMIARANIAIENIPKIPAYNTQLLGEAYAIRAYAYFHAIRVWGDVPLFLDALKGFDQDIQRPKTKASEIMEKVIIPDMLKAETLLTQNSNNFRFSKAAIWSLQAEVYMFQKDYAKAKAALTNIVRLGAYSLVNTREAWVRMFLNDVALGGKIQTGTELIFSIRFELADTDRSNVQGTFFNGIPNYFVSPRLENKWIAKFPTDSLEWFKLYPTTPPRIRDAAGRFVFGDWRFIESRESGRTFGGARMAKYQKNAYNLPDETDMPIYRYANTILLLAEAENQLGNRDASVALLNQIRTARQLPIARAADFTTKEQLEDVLLDERHFEFVGEGVRWWDLRRTGKVVQIMGPINGQTQQKLLFPIFDRHLIDNPKLTQTEGY